jgi:hypothetical protein
VTRRKKRKKPRGGGSYDESKTNQRVPLVHVKIAHVERDLGAATALIKPAVLYADRVTLYSPVASLLTSVAGLEKVEGSRARVLAILDVVEEVPSNRRTTRR